jgi:orotate phosphoribosyltransferase
MAIRPATRVPAECQTGAMAPTQTDPTAGDRRADLLEVVRDLGLIRFDEPRQLSSGEMSRDFIDAKRALAAGRDLRLACRVIADSISALGISFDAVGGLTLGADQFAHGVAAVLGDDTEWFVIRKKPKGRGTDQLVEGAPLAAGRRVLLVDDVVTTGGSIQQAYHNVVDTGAEVVAASTLVDRGDDATAFFDGLGITYAPVFTYRDLGIDPVGRAAG